MIILNNKERDNYFEQSKHMVPDQFTLMEQLLSNVLWNNM